METLISPVYLYFKIRLYQTPINTSRETPFTVHPTYYLVRSFHFNFLRVQWFRKFSPEEGRTDRRLTFELDRPPLHAKDCLKVKNKEQICFNILVMDIGIRMKRRRIWMLTLLFRAHVVLGNYSPLLRPNSPIWDRSCAHFTELFIQSVLVECLCATVLVKIDWEIGIRQGLWLGFNTWIT